MTRPTRRPVPVDTTDPQRALDGLYAARAGGDVPVLGATSGRHLPDHLDTGDAFAVVTSGTTGTGRAVVRTWASWQASFAPFTDVTGIGAGDVVLVPGPLSSSLFLFGAVHARESGARLLATGRWRPAEAVAALADATAVHLTPSMLRTLLDRAPGALEGRKVVCAGAGLPAATAARTGARVTHYYGAAELSFVAAGTHADDLRPFPGVTVDVRAGEIWARSPYVAAGYLGDAGALRTRDGWATVGDRGRVLPDGRLRVDGRGDQLVLTGGVSVPVADVEAALRPALGGADVVVVGAPHPDLGEVVTAVLEGPDGTLPDRATLRDVASVLDAAHRPRRWLVVPELPRTEAGKVARARVRTRLREGSLPARSLP